MHSFDQFLLFVLTEVAFGNHQIYLHDMPKNGHPEGVQIVKNLEMHFILGYFHNTGHPNAAFKNFMTFFFQQKAIASIEQSMLDKTRINL
jgi:hypothetical protein